MVLGAFVYIGLLLFLSAMLGLQRAFLYTSFLPLLVFCLPLLQFMGASMSVVAFPFGICGIIGAYRRDIPVGRAIIATALTSLPLIILATVLVLDKIY